jgi:hypothetical protein
MEPADGRSMPRETMADSFKKMAGTFNPFPGQLCYILWHELWHFSSDWRFRAPGTGLHGLWNARRHLKFRGTVGCGTNGNLLDGGIAVSTEKAAGWGTGGFQRF